MHYSKSNSAIRGYLKGIIEIWEEYAKLSKKL